MYLGTHHAVGTYAVVAVRCGVCLIFHSVLSIEIASFDVRLRFPCCAVVFAKYLFCDLVLKHVGSVLSASVVERKLCCATKFNKEKNAACGREYLKSNLYLTSIEKDSFQN